LWDDLKKCKADITFVQLLEVSPIVRKTLKVGLLVAQRSQRPPQKLVARAQVGKKPFDIKAVEIEVVIVDKVILHTLVDGGSGLNILPLHTMEKLGLSLTGPSPIYY